MDVASNFSLLHAKLSKLGFDSWVSVSEGDVMTGDPHTFAGFLLFLYQRFPAATATLLRSFEWFLVEADDSKIGAATIRLLAESSARAPVLSPLQFSQHKYAMVKINLCHDLLRLLRSLTPRTHSDSPDKRKSSPQVGDASVTARLASASPATAATESMANLRIKERRRELNSVRRA